LARILVVDDSAVMRMNISKVLVRAGHEVVDEAVNGSQAYVKYKQLLPDLVTMDITMPIMSGVEAVKKIKDEFPEAKIIMVSALDQKQYVFEAFKNGAKHYIVKPIVPEKVISVVNEVLGISSQSANKEESKIVETPVASVAPQKVEQPTAFNILERMPFKASDTEKYFSVQLVDQTLQIKLTNLFYEKSFGMLSYIVFGLLFIQPLKVNIDFGGIEDIDDFLLVKIGDMVKLIQSANGTVQVLSQSVNFAQKVRGKHIDGISDLIKNNS
jgi:two-component system chemotaxis response regulator CheY